MTGKALRACEEILSSHEWARCGCLVTGGDYVVVL
jgi:hypothetical protein